jgi:1,4-dihydroxy-6-naphthoate synthase
MRLSLGFSPCPNDTFIFHGIVSGGLQLDGYAFDPCLHDVQTLNQMAFEQVLDITKLSFYAWLMVRHNYRLLASGGALGYGCGPLVVARKQMTRADMAGCRLVIPGQWTTAHLLLRLWAPEAQQRTFTTYDRIYDQLLSGKADCGVIIHESRFTFEQAGFKAVVDLGAWWEEQTGLPIPLGCIAVHKRLPEILHDRLEKLIRQSIRQARENPEPALPYIHRHAQELTADILQKHIDTFVNEFSLDLGATGRQAINELADRAKGAGLLLNASVGR